MFRFTEWLLSTTLLQHGQLYVKCSAPSSWEADIKRLLAARPQRSKDNEILESGMTNASASQTTGKSNTLKYSNHLEPWQSHSPWVCCHFWPTEFIPKNLQGDHMLGLRLPMQIPMSDSCLYTNGAHTAGVVEPVGRDHLTGKQPSDCSHQKWRLETHTVYLGWQESWTLHPLYPLTLWLLSTTI